MSKKLFERFAHANDSLGIGYTEIDFIDHPTDSDHVLIGMPTHNLDNLIYRIRSRDEIAALKHRLTEQQKEQEQPKS